MSGATLLEVRELTKRYYGLTAVDRLGFTLEAGSITGMIGPNGSGKSTTIDCISGFQSAQGGRWWLDGVELTGRPAHVHARAGLTRTFQMVRAYEELSLVENMLLAAQEHDGIGWLGALRGGARIAEAERAGRARALGLLAKVGLAGYADAPAEILSYGQRKLLIIAATMMTRPKLVVLDEPVAGVNPTMIRRIEQAIRDLNAEGVALLIVEHNMEFIMSLCERVIVLDQGRLLADGPPERVRADPRVLEAYLGVEAP